MIRRYPSTLSFTRGHVPVHHRRRRRCWNIKALASKLLIDQYILFDILAPRVNNDDDKDENVDHDRDIGNDKDDDDDEDDDATFRQLLDQRHRRIVVRHFTVLVSPRDFTLTPWAQGQKDAYSMGGNGQHAVKIGMCPDWGVALLRRRFAALSKEGNAKDNPGIFERWVRQKAGLILGRSD